LIDGRVPQFMGNATDQRRRRPDHHGGRGRCRHVASEPCCTGIRGVADAGYRSRSNVRNCR
jgi:hypothetical protein